MWFIWNERQWFERQELLPAELILKANNVITFDNVEDNATVTVRLAYLAYVFICVQQDNSESWKVFRVDRLCFF